MPFTQKDLHSLNRSFLSILMDCVHDRVGVTATAHQLRHGFATLLYEAGIDEREAMELMGHADITLTHKIYTHIRKSRKEETAARLNETANKF
ncbi:MAG: tyrosine-type recombinase/integrase [Dethiobacteria bacterium]